MSRSNRRSAAPGLAAVVAACAGGLLAGETFAQNALDAPSGNPASLSPQPIRGQVRGAVGGGRGGFVMPQGNALDANLGVYSGGMNAPAARIDYNARNLVVTDSVAGGRGFRGSVGYVADTDFRGVAGSDANYRFRAYSAESNPVWINTPRSYDQFQIAQGIGQFEFRRESTVMPLGMQGTSFSQPDARLRLDRQNSALNIGNTVQFNAQPIDFAQGTDGANNPVNYFVSPIQGLRMERISDPLFRSGLSPYEKAVAREDISTGRIAPEAVQRTFLSPLGTALDTKMQPESLLDLSRGQAYDAIVRTVVQTYSNVPNVRIDADPRAIERAKEELATLRGTLRGSRPGLPSQGEREGFDPTALPEPGVDPLTGFPMRTKPAESDAAKTPEATIDPAKTDEQRRRLEAERLTNESIRRMAETLRHGNKVADLSPGDRARVDQLVRSAQESMGRGEYFIAERGFADALALNPGNPMLIAGLANCQLGAGLNLSAALSLRELFTSHPEMIDTRYELRLLPSQERMRRAVDALRVRIAGEADADSYGLLLAYLGHQLEDRELVREGLPWLKGSPENDALRTLLEGIWRPDRSRPTP